jgi:hypothetical protein
VSGFVFTAAIITAASMARVRTVYRRPVFTGVVDVTLPVSRRRCSGRLEDVGYHNVAYIQAHQYQLN